MTVGGDKNEWAGTRMSQQAQKQLLARYGDTNTIMWAHVKQVGGHENESVGTKMSRRA